MSHLLILQDSAIHSKDMAFDVEEFIKSKNASYKFSHYVETLYSFFHDAETGKFILAHRSLSKENYKTHPAFYKEISITDLMGHLAVYDNVFVMAADLPANITDQQLLGMIDFYHRADNGDFINCATKEVVTKDSGEIYCFNIMTVFRLSPLPVSVAVMNVNYVMNLVEDVTVDEVSIRSSSANKTVKNHFFDVRFTEGVEDIIGKETAFVSGDTVKMTLFSPEVSLMGLDVEAVKKAVEIRSTVPYTFDGYTIVLDTSDMAQMSSGFFRVELFVHDFFERFIYESQRTYYEFNLYRMRA